MGILSRGAQRGMKSSDRSQADLQQAPFSALTRHVVLDEELNLLIRLVWQLNETLRIKGLTTHELFFSGSKVLG